MQNLEYKVVPDFLISREYERLTELPLEDFIYEIENPELADEIRIAVDALAAEREDAYLFTILAGEPKSFHAERIWSRTLALFLERLTDTKDTYWDRARISDLPDRVELARLRRQIEFKTAEKAEEIASQKAQYLGYWD